MLATLGEMPIAIDAYAYEVKWDGYRALCARQKDGLQLTSRNGIDLLPRFPEVAGLRQALPRETLVDGELMALDAADHGSFSALQTRMPRVRGVDSGQRWDPAKWRVTYVIFDLLRLRGHDLMALPWSERRRQLVALGLEEPGWATPRAVDDGVRLLAEVKAAHGEGIIAKRRSAPYLPGIRSRDWLKIKLVRRDEFVIGGFWRRSPHSGLGSLLLGRFATPAAAKAGTLEYAGKVGTGFTAATRHELEVALSHLAQAKPPFTTPVPATGVVWCKPELVAEIGYAEWTHGDHLRQARFQGLRFDKPARLVLASNRKLPHA